MPDDVFTYVLVDGENIDGALGGILNHKPDPGQRPRWQHLLTFAEAEWRRPVRGLFFINATRGLHAAFVQALIASGFRPLPIAGTGDEKVVDIAIQRTFDALRDRAGDVMLASHDADFVEQMRTLTERPDRRVGVVAFKELMSQSLRDVPRIEIFDLEEDACAFEFELPRVRVIRLDEFDPNRYL